MTVPKPFHHTGSGKRRRLPPRPTRRALVFGLAALLGAGSAFSDAAVNTLHRRAPELALVIDSDDAVALVRRAELALAAGDPEVRSEDFFRRTVQRSVARLPINGPAFRLYGLSGAAGSDLRTVRAQMQLSDRMERRDPGAQLWLIESAVADNDIDRALRHYDRALRIEESSREILYPVLTQAMDSAIIRQRFAPYMSAVPPWLESFLRFAVSKTQTPSSLAELARVSGGWPKGAAFSSLDTELLARLVDNEDFLAAAHHFQRMEIANIPTLTNVRLSERSTDWRSAPMTWQPFRIDGIEPFIVASAQGGDAVEIEAQLESGYTGPVARKFLTLKPGAYRFSARMRGKQHSRRDTARWVIACAGGSQQHPLLGEDLALGERMDLDARFSVPAQCPVQEVGVSVQTMVTTRYVTLVLASASLEPLNGIVNGADAAAMGPD